MFGHWIELMGLALLALLIFGPRRMMEMGSTLGKAVREFREATKEMSWPGLGGEGDVHSPTPTPPGGGTQGYVPTPDGAEPHVVEGSVQPTEER